MESPKSKRRAIKSGTSSSGDRRAGSVGERPELARAGSKDSSDPTRTTGTKKRSGTTEPAEA